MVQSSIHASQGQRLEDDGKRELVRDAAGRNAAAVEGEGE